MFYGHKIYHQFQGYKISIYTFEIQIINYTIQTVHGFILLYPSSNSKTHILNFPIELYFFNQVVKFMHFCSMYLAGLMALYFFINCIFYQNIRSISLVLKLTFDYLKFLLICLVSFFTYFTDVSRKQHMVGFFYLSDSESFFLLKNSVHSHLVQ